ncbi:MAG: c-type cytochrome [Aeromonas sp.]
MQKWVYALPLLALAWGHQAKAADIEAGKAKAAVCAACHGVAGKASVPVYPHLAGQQEAYLVKQLKAFKDGSRKEPLMVPFMAPLTDADMENLAAYYASLK